MDHWIVWNGKNYAPQCHACGHVAVRGSTMVRHLSKHYTSPKSTLDMRPQGSEIEAGAVDSDVATLEGADGQSTLDMRRQQGERELLDSDAGQSLASDEEAQCAPYQPDMSSR